MVQKRDNIKLDIVALLLKGESHVRKIAHKLGQPHSTISRRLNELKLENAADSRKEGKNKIFFLRQNIISRNYAFQAESHKLIKLLQKHPWLSIVFEEILKKTGKNLVVLFGSYAKGLEKKGSDIDIYIETKDRNIKKITESVHSKINAKIGPFDTSSPLIKEIIKDYIILRGIEVFYEKQVSENAGKGRKA